MRASARQPGSPSRAYIPVACSTAAWGVFDAPGERRQHGNVVARRGHFREEPFALTGPDGLGPVSVADDVPARVGSARQGDGERRGCVGHNGTLPYRAPRPSWVLKTGRLTGRLPFPAQNDSDRPENVGPSTGIAT